MLYSYKLHAAAVNVDSAKVPFISRGQLKFAMPPADNNY